MTHPHHKERITVQPSPKAEAFDFRSDAIGCNERWRSEIRNPAVRGADIRAGTSDPDRRHPRRSAADVFKISETRRASRDHREHLAIAEDAFRGAVDVGLRHRGHEGVAAADVIDPETLEGDLH